MLRFVSEPWEPHAEFSGSGLSMAWYF